MHCPGFFIADPDVHTSTTGVDVHELGEAKVFRKGSGDDFFGDDHELPAVLATLFTLATGSNVIVVIHIKIENEFPLHGFELLGILGGRTCPNCPSVQLSGRFVIHRCHPPFEFVN